jgi:tetrahydromethanopterin S-methyltransferase subunit G
MADPLEWLRQDIQSVKEDVKNINSKVDEMLSFKYQIVGGSVALSAIIGILIQIMLVYMAK